MGMTPEEFFDGFVRGNYEDCEQYPGCVRRAFNAAVSTSHLADHYWAYYQKYDQSKVDGFKTIGDFLESLSTNTEGCFRDIRSIANAYKHLYTSVDPKRAVHSSISSTGAIESISLTDEGAEVKVFEEQWTSDSGGNNYKLKVIYTRKDGQRVEFMRTLYAVFSYLESLLRK